MKKKIEVRQSSIDNRGVFATDEISKGERVVQYTGRRLTKAQANRSESGISPAGWSVSPDNFVQKKTARH